MADIAARADPGPLTTWARSTARERASAPSSAGLGGRSARFALYGRMSTTEYQDAATSAGWQRQLAEDLLAGHGVIAAQFFDIGVSRRVPWPERPQAAALLTALDDPRRGFDAVVVGGVRASFPRRSVRRRHRHAGPP